MKLQFKILPCIIGIINVSCCTVHPEAIAPIGKIRGSILNSRLGQKIYSFRGIKYAESPTGERRFQVPIPAADWSNVFDASKEGPACPSLDNVKPMSEDCLRLNVYTKKLPSKCEDEKTPVLVFFHPGGFYSFSGQSFYFGPQYLMDHNIVLVTVNYRLGSLGFISTGDSLAPGNLGFKDQVVALRWVQRNIAAFGGDANSVTISGYSVGALSTILHMVSPMSKHLFHRAIVMSAWFASTGPFPTDQNDLAKKQAQLLHCPTNNSREMLTCLKSKPVENFTKTMADFFEWYGDPIIVWKPVVEPEVSGIERFLPAQPYDLIRQGKFHQVPAIFGVTKDEFGGVVVAFENRTKAGYDMYREMSDNWYRIAPISFIYDRKPPRSEYISRELRQFYFNGQPLSSANRDGLAHIYADSVIIFPTYRTAKLIATNSRVPVYFYKFTYQGRYSFTMWNATTPYGVVHQDDLQYLFFMKDIFPYFNETAPEIPMVKLYTSMWTSFIGTGKPVPEDGAFSHITWDRFVPEQNNYLEINVNPTMKTGLYPDRMEEWEKLFPLSLVSQA
ncbi:Esterase FE4 [Eufriesea mexicana]|uniref:Esterase FE4 n=1 Tax=Eufriesea mexicana TaxID=516756 RepID=A0A310SK91_9HYME|nr:Esterase FE4 [Eufriesea mexicana]